MFYSQYVCIIQGGETLGVFVKMIWTYEMSLIEYVCHIPKWNLTYKQQVSLLSFESLNLSQWSNPDSKVHGANMGPTWVLSALYGPHVGPMNLAIREDNE